MKNLGIDLCSGKWLAVDISADYSETVCFSKCSF